MPSNSYNIESVQKVPNVGRRPFESVVKHKFNPRFCGSMVTDWFHPKNRANISTEDFMHVRHCTLKAGLDTPHRTKRANLGLHKRNGIGVVPALQKDLICSGIKGNKVNVANDTALLSWRYMHDEAGGNASVVSIAGGCQPRVQYRYRLASYA